MKVVIVGGGAAGMMAAIGAAENKDNQVILLEKNEKVGKKIYITGKGRCNVTNASDVEYIRKQITKNSKFMYSALYTLTSDTLIQMIETTGVKTKIERGNRVFPLSDKSSDINKALLILMKQRNVQIIYNKQMKDILLDETKKKVNGVVCTDHSIYKADKVIVATGGKAYGMTGSTGDGYELARKYKHKVLEISPGLCPMETKETDIFSLQGLAMKNVKVTLCTNKKKIYEEQGEMLFTHFGISGPLILSASNHLPRDTKEKYNNEIIIDMKPALSKEKLDQRLLREFEKNANKDIMNTLKELCPNKLIPILLERAGVEERKTTHQLTKKERIAILEQFKAFTLPIRGMRSFNEAIITRGGIDVKDIDPHTMMSKKVNGLYFAGEVLDIEAYTGGFNLQIAFSTGYLAGIS